MSRKRWAFKKRRIIIKIFKKLISNVVIGIGIGAVITYIITIIIGKTFTPAVPAFLEQFPNETVAVGGQFVTFASLGLLQGLASSTFNKVDNTHSLLTLTAIRYGLIVLPLLLAGCYLKWFSLNLLAFIGFLLPISGIYGVVYLFNYLAIKKDIREINTKLG